MGRRNVLCDKLGLAKEPKTLDQEVHSKLCAFKERNLELLKAENRVSKKRKRNCSVSALENKLIKTRFYEISNKNHKKESTEKNIMVTKRKLLDVLESLKKPKKAIKSTTCNKFENNCVLWDSPLYIFRHMRSCILNHNWNHLTRLLLFLLKHHPRYLPFVKQIGFLDFVVNPASSNSEVLEEYFQQCFVKVESDYKTHFCDICINDKEL